MSCEALSAIHKTRRKLAFGPDGLLRHQVLVRRHYGRPPAATGIWPQHTFCARWSFLCLRHQTEVLTAARAEASTSTGYSYDAYDSYASYARESGFPPTARRTLPLRPAPWRAAARVTPKLALARKICGTRVRASFLGASGLPKPPSPVRRRGAHRQSGVCTAHHGQKDPCMNLRLAEANRPTPTCNSNLSIGRGTKIHAFCNESFSRAAQEQGCRNRRLTP